MMTTRSFLAPINHINPTDLETQSLHDQHGYPLDVQVIDGRKFNLYDLAVSQPLASLFDARRKLKIPTSEEGQAPLGPSLPQLLCRTKVWATFREMNQSRQDLDLMDVLVDYVDLAPTPYRREPFIVATGQVMCLEINGNIGPVVLALGKPAEINEAELQKIEGAGKFFDLRKSAGDEGRDIQTGPLHAGSFHILSWETFYRHELAGELPPSALEEMRTKQLDAMSPYRRKLAEQTLADMPTPFFCPVDIEWSGTYVGDLSSLFALVASVNTPAPSFDPENGENFETFLTTEVERRSRLLERVQSEKVRIENIFWYDFNPGIGLPFRSMVGLDKNRPPVVSYWSRRPADAGLGQDHLAAQVTRLFEATAMIIDNARQRLGNAKPSRDDEHPRIDLFANVSWQPAHSWTSVRMGRISLAKICDHILHTFNPAGETPCTDTNSNRTDKIVPHLASVGRYDLDQALSAHQVVKARKELLVFLVADCGLDRLEADKLITGLSSSTATPEEFAEIGLDENGRQKDS